jgi:hypothetical protein
MKLGGKRAARLIKLAPEVTRTEHCEWALPLLAQMSERRLGMSWLDHKEPWPSALQALRVPAVAVVDDRPGYGPEPFHALRRGRFWPRAAYVVVDAAPDVTKVLALAQKHVRVLVIMTRADRASAWAGWLKTCPGRKHAVLRAPGRFLDQHGLAVRAAP